MKNLGFSDKLSYAQMAFPLAFAGLPLYIHAPDFYAINYGVSLGFLGASLLAVRLVDAFADPFIGRFCDVYSRHRAAIMGIASLVFAFSFAALYRPPAALEIFWFVSAVFFATLSFSVLLINLNAIGALMAQDAAAKTTVSVWREGFGVAGLMAAMLLPAVFSDMPAYASFCCVIALLSSAVFIRWYKKQNFEQSTGGQSARPGFRVLLSGWFSRFFTVYGVSMLASSFSAVLFLFFVRDWLGAEDKAGLFLALYFLCAIAAMPFWRGLSTRFAAQNLWASSMCLSVIGISLAAFVQTGDLALYAVVCVVSGVAFGGELFLPPAILSARISHDELDAHTSSYFGFYAFCMKIALAGATAIAFGALDAAGFKPASDNDTAGLCWLVGLYAIVPAILKLCAILVFVKSGDRHETPLRHYNIGGRHAS